MIPIFIVGSPRTGTHWLRRVLSEHESIVSNPYESHVFPLILGPFLHSRLPWNRSWRIVNKNYVNSHLSEWISFENFQKLQNEFRSKKVNNSTRATFLAKSILDKYYEMHKTEQSRYLLEKSPNHVYYFNTIKEVYKSFKIIEMQRHPVDVMKSLKVLSIKKEEWVPKEFSQLVKVWIRATEAGIQCKRQAESHNILSIKYEDLISDFDSTLEKTSLFLEINFSSTELKSLEGKYKRTGEGGKADIYPLTSKEYDYIKNKTFSLCKELGYQFEN